MIKNVERAWFEVWGNETAQNVFLKGILAFFIVLLTAFAAALAVLATRHLPLVAIGQQGSCFVGVTPPSAELLAAERQRVAKAYVLAHYNWQWQTVDDSFKEAGRYVAPEFLKAFWVANAEQAKVVKVKRLVQRFYAVDVSVSPNGETATVKGERVLAIDGLRAATPMTLEVSLKDGARTDLNPQGIYVTAEKMIAEKGG